MCNLINEDLMKRKFLWVLALPGILMLASCTKTITCIDANGNVVGEVRGHNAEACAKYLE